MQRGSRVAMLAFVAGVLATSAWSQVDVSAWPQVRVEMLALGGNGEPLAGLSKDALVVNEGKKAHGVLDVQPAQEPQSVCVLIDASGSMYTRLSLVLTKARRLVKNLPAGDEVCVASFSRGMELNLALTGDRRAVEPALGQVKASDSGSAVRDSLAALAEYMRGTAKFKSRAIVLFSDGADNSSKLKWEQMKQGFEADGSPVVHMICLPPAMGNARYKQVDPEERAAERLSKPTGGLTYFPHNMTDINSIVDNLGKVLATRYVVTFVAENAAKDGQEQRMQMSFEKSHRTEKAEVLAPEGYYAPSH